MFTVIYKLNNTYFSVSFTTKQSLLLVWCLCNIFILVVLVFYHQVEEILGVRKRGATIQYLVKWKGYGPDDNTWEPSKNLTDAKDAIEEFLRKQNEPTKVCIYLCILTLELTIGLNSAQIRVMCFRIIVPVFGNTAGKLWYLWKVDIIFFLLYFLFMS